MRPFVSYSCFIRCIQGVRELSARLAASVKYGVDG